MRLHCFVWSVDSTKCPVSPPVKAAIAEARSRTSPYMRMSGSSRMLLEIACSHVFMAAFGGLVGEQRILWRIFDGQNMAGAIRVSGRFIDIDLQGFRLAGTGRASDEYHSVRKPQSRRTCWICTGSKQALPSTVCSCRLSADAKPLTVRQPKASSIPERRTTPAGRQTHDLPARPD